MQQEDMRRPTKKSAATRSVPSEILEKIFFLLPNKTLARLKTVCKHWCSCIADDQFIDRYRNRDIKHPQYILSLDYSSEGPPEKLCMYNIGRDSYTHVRSMAVPRCYEGMLASSYGLVCLHGIVDGNRSIAVFNPATRDIVPLPDYPEPLTSYVIEFSVGPDYDREHFKEKQYNDLGFGFDPRSRKYIVVQLVRDSSTSGISRCYVLTAGRIGSSWKAVDVSLNCKLSFHAGSLCVDGVLYWENQLLHPEEFVQILAFDLSSEEFRMISSPCKLRLDAFARGRHLVELQGNLCFAELVSESGSLQVNIWMLKYSGCISDWTRIHRLELGSLCLFPLFMRNDGILLRDVDDKALYFYDVAKKSLRNYGGDGEHDKLSFWFRATPMDGSILEPPFEHILKNMLI